MDYIIGSSTDRELEKMQEYARVAMEERSAKNKSAECPVDKHQYITVYKGRNKIVRVCDVCQHESFTYFKNEDLRYIEANLHKFAQPGTDLWRKLYGDKTLEEVRELNFNQ